MPESRLLSGLDRVDWSRLRHAYGAAVDVPGLIRALVDPGSADAETKATARRERKSVFDVACWELWGNVFHQGTVYQASAPTIPFLVEILRDGPRRHDLRRFLVRYLAHLAMGYPDGVFPARFDPDDEFRAIQSLADPPHDQEDEADLRQLIYRRDCYEAVERAVPVFARFIDDADLETALEAIAAVTWFPRVADLVGASLTQAVRCNQLARAGTALVAAAHLRLPCAAELADSFIDAKDRVFAIHAACASVLSGIDAGRAAGVLTAPLGRLADVRTPLTGTVGELVGRCLPLLPATDLEAALDALIRQLITATPMVAVSITEAMLDLVFQGDSAPGGASALTSVQRLAIRAIADHGAFEVAGGIYAKYASLLRRRGLPSTSDDLCDWLDR